jgi:hypothetical protein
MKLELKTTPGMAPYYTVLVEKDELICGSKPMPFSTWLGTIEARTFAIHLWTPAGGAPRGYRKAAMKALEEAVATLRKETT